MRMIRKLANTLAGILTSPGPLSFNRPGLCYSKIGTKMITIYSIKVTCLGGSKINMIKSLIDALTKVDACTVWHVIMIIVVLSQGVVSSVMVHTFADSEIQPRRLVEEQQ